MGISSFSTLGGSSSPASCLVIEHHASYTDSTARDAVIALTAAEARRLRALIDA